MLQPKQKLAVLTRNAAAIMLCGVTIQRYVIVPYAMLEAFEKKIQVISVTKQVVSALF